MAAENQSNSNMTLKIIAVSKTRSFTSRINHWAGASWKLLALPLVLFIAIPLCALLTRIPASQLIDNLKQEQIHQFITLSLMTSITTTLVTLLLSTPVAYLLAQRLAQIQIQ